ncbi:hypothetical protein CIHG_09267 [Coccidioides immitis H538.4]|uniref:Uncharacterized protein n=2 Tax=Coccidioides immitis TaxID=5501 RepID=A0A0J8R7A0_COCIT|nr:hypothetical protein CISG_02016 [Coccidioides immitis RMSCC 3703]KMU91515.1 hypothetical protein CIHG_09267 [Coccidioides immitis H538.4]
MSQWVPIKVSSSSPRCRKHGAQQLVSRSNGDDWNGGGRWSNPSTTLHMAMSINSLLKKGVASVSVLVDMAEGMEADGESGKRAPRELAECPPHRRDEGRCGGSAR